MRLSERVSRMKPSATMAMDAKAKDMVAEGKDVLSFALGEPDFPTPPDVCEAGIQAIRGGHTKYTPASGTVRLKKAICAAAERDLGLTVTPAEICVGNGAKHILADIFGAMVNPGDHVILVAPYWVSYADLIELFDGTFTAVEAPADRDFVPDIAAIEAAVTDRTIAVLINSPSNPSGGVFAQEDIAALADVAVRRNLTIISDEIYKHILFDGRAHFSPAMVSEEARKRTIIVDGVSKTYSMTGWRIGWSIAPADFTKGLGTLQSQMTSNPNSIAQEAAADALLGPQDAVEAMRAEFGQRRDVIVGLLNAIPGVSCRRPGGAFYAFPDVSSYFGKTLRGRKIETSTDMSMYLLDEGLVSTVPGDAFGVTDNIRLSFACSTEDIRRGCERIAEALAG
ncbi:MAG: pyridoxal phosphate-dependent aminotransferase [Armatimonadetes bacterium]|nr:pyridoxal phosphate-dependent aminotransferase [Armatimonadota bacterium]